MPQRFMDHGGVDPAQHLIDKIGYIDDVEVPLNKVLLGIYLRPEKTKSNIILPDGVRDEDLYQGKACLVLKLGPVAFKDDDKFSFHGYKAEIGQWVVIRPSDGMKLDINGVRCVLLADTQCQLVIPSPDMVF